NERVADCSSSEQLSHGLRLRLLYETGDSLPAIGLRRTRHDIAEIAVGSVGLHTDDNDFSAVGAKQRNGSHQMPGEPRLILEVVVSGQDYGVRAGVLFHDVSHCMQDSESCPAITRLDQEVRGNERSQGRLP